MQGAHAVELAEVEPRLLRQVRTHILVTDDRHPRDVRVVPFHPVLVVGNVFSVEQLVGGRVFAQLVF